MVGWVLIHPLFAKICFLGGFDQDMRTLEVRGDVMFVFDQAQKSRKVDGFRQKWLQ